MTAEKSMAAPRSEFQTEEMGGKIYAIGGRGEAGVLSSMEAFTAEE